MDILGLGIMSTRVSSWHELAAREYLVIATWELMVLCLLAWLGSLGLFLQSVKRLELRMRTKLFSISVGAAALYALAFVPSRVFNGSTLKASVETLSPLWLVSVLYILIFVSKSLLTAEKQIPVTFAQYLGLFFLLWFFPVGVWFIQPKINRLFRDRIAQHRQGPSG
jgi:hypothetical protein